MLMEPKKPSPEKRAESERALDEAIEESFPASDPPSNTPTSAGGPEDSRKPRKAGARSPVKKKRG